MLFVLFLITSCNLSQKSAVTVVVPTLTRESTKMLPTIIPTQTLVPPTATPTPTSTPTMTPTATPLVIDYKIKGEIDLGNGLPVAMAIYLTDGRVIKSNWASAISYKDGDDPMVFDPYAGTIYSHNDGGFLASWIHSGYLKNGNELFGYSLEKEVWLNNASQRLTLEDGKKRTAALIGAKVILCQASAESKVKPFAKYDEKGQCSGKQMEFTVLAASLVEREKADEYESSIGNVVNWMTQNYPDQGFSNLTQRSSYLIQTCVGRYSDQKDDGTIDYIYNRLILGLSLRE